MSHAMTETATERTIAKTNPQDVDSMPFTRFMPNKEAMSVGHIIMIDTDVSVRITVFILLLIMEE